MPRFCRHYIFSSHGGRDCGQIATRLLYYPDNPEHGDPRCENHVLAAVAVCHVRLVIEPIPREENPSAVRADIPSR